ncbi:MAG TPA: hypothetical protein VFA20_31930 [Myxococcaceae bacterium]|nr:hypothetical protein [Myxococcaceae bacterium]
MKPALLAALAASLLAAAAAPPAAPAAPAAAPAAAPDAGAPPPGADGGTPSSAAPATLPEKVSPKIFDEGLSLYFTANYKEAARRFYAYLEAMPQTDDNYAWAQYFLGESLVKLKLTHAGAYYLARIAREHNNPEVVPRALEGLRELIDGPHDEVMIDEQVFAALDLGFVGGETGDYANYQQGLLDLRAGNERWANTHFSKITEGTAAASRARFAVLVTRLKDAKEVNQELIQDFWELGHDLKLSLETRNEALLAAARLRYERKDFQGALDAYRQVKLPALDPGQASLYLEEAWTRYNLGQIHASMGILNTLDAPAFRDEFLPDKYLLRAMIFRDLCHYLPAKRAAKELTRKYAESLEAIRERDDLTRDLRMVRAAASIGPTRRAYRFYESLQLEGENLGRFAGSFGDRLYGHLSRLYVLAVAEAQRVYEARLRESVRQEADKLVRAAEQVRIMDYEIGLKLYERIKKGSKLVKDVEEPPLTPKQVGFPFDGEYWNDELRDYRVSLKSRCIEGIDQ